MSWVSNVIKIVAHFNFKNKFARIYNSEHKFDFLGGYFVVTARYLVVTGGYCLLFGGYYSLLLVTAPFHF